LKLLTKQKTPIMKYIFASLLFCIFHSAHTQQVEISGHLAERVFLNEADQSENFYVALAPSIKIKGLLVILPGYGTYPGGFLKETDLPAKARENGYLVIIPYLVKNSFYTDSLSQTRLGALITKVIQKYSVPENKFIIGGHSAGGNGALLYAEAAYQQKKKDLVRPQMVFGVDPPLDMARLYHTFEYIKKINFSKTAVKEAEYFLDWYKRELHGTPEQEPAAYEKISSFSRTTADGGKIKYLSAIPVRLYCDPDIQWYIENRAMPYEHLNMADLSACIVQLRISGNKKAELVTNLGKGYFAGGVRHPHGFTSLDSTEFLLWVNAYLDN
jgi:hypothetical protein